MSENSKESASLKSSQEQFSELSILSKEKDKIIKKTPKYSIYLKVILIIFIIILSLSLMLLFFFHKEIFEMFKNDKDKTNEIKIKKTKKLKTLSCDEGFYIPKNDKSECRKCTIKFCSKCIGDKDENTCLSCMESYEAVKDDENKIKKCIKTYEKGNDNMDKDGECKLCNQLNEGKDKVNYSIKALYKTKKDKQNILLINKNYEEYLKELIINDKVVKPSFNYTFDIKGQHTVLIILNDNEIESGKMMFYNISNLISIEFTNNFKTDKMINMRGMFKDCPNLKILDLKHFNTKKVTDLSYMFDNCSSLKSIDLDSFETKNVRDISYMFSNCEKLSSISLSHFNTVNIVDMSGLFYGCSSLELINLSKFQTKNTEYMLYMFEGCSSLTSIDISSFKTKKVKDMSYMFKDCSKIKKIDLSELDTQNVNNMEGMFKGCSSLTSIDLKNFKTKNVKYIQKMFYGCKKLKKIDMTSFVELKGNSTLGEFGIFDNNSSKVGNIKINKKFYECIKSNIPSKWEVEYKKNLNKKLF